jgi:hypothetical protein
MTRSARGKARSCFYSVDRVAALGWKAARLRGFGSGKNEANTTGLGPEIERVLTPEGGQ